MHRLSRRWVIGALVLAGGCVGRRLARLSHSLTLTMLASLTATVLLFGHHTDAPARQDRGALGWQASVHNPTASPTPVPARDLAAHQTTPSAGEFAVGLAGSTNQYARAHGHATRIDNVHCVQASPGHYMCSYRSTAAGAQAKCHIMQARWTPDAASSFTVTLAGRAARCRTLSDALESLR